MELHSTFVFDQWTGVRDEFRRAAERFINALDATIDASKATIEADPGDHNYEQVTIRNTQEIIDDIADAIADYDKDSSELEEEARSIFALVERVKNVWCQRRSEPPDAEFGDC